MDIPVNAAKPGRRRYLTLVMIFITVVICYVDRANGRGFRPYSGRVRHYESGNGLCIFGLRTALYAMPDPRRLVFRSRRFSRDLFYCDIWLVSGDFIRGFATGLMSLIGLRAITGIFEAPAFPTNNRMVTSWFPEHERASAVGFIRLVSLSVWRF